MVTFRCFSVLIGRKNKIKGNEQSLDEGLKTLRVQIDHPAKSSESDELKPTTLDVSLPCGIQKNSRCNVRVISMESPAKAEADEAYEGEDEHEDVISMKRDNSDFDLQAHVAFAAEDGEDEITFPNLCETQANKHLEDKSNKDIEKCVQMIQSGHVSDPGIGRAVFWASPKLMRSCSNLERRDVLRKTAHQLYSSMSQSYEDLQELSANHMFTFESPRSVMTHRSADRVMLKRHSSIQLLPSRSRRLWWKLFLWSHRNVHRPWTNKLTQLFPSSAALKRQGGYTSDTLEPKQGKVSGNLESPGSFTGESLNIISTEENIDTQSWRGFSTGDSGLWPQNQWVAFSAESSSFARVDEWVKELEAQEPLPVDDNDNNAESIVFPPSPHASGSAARHPAQLVRHPDVNLSKEILNASAIIVQSLNPTSTAAHISAIGLKNIPAISHFCSLRSVNLSNNFIVHITPGLLPKGLHTLDLSRNKISTIEGFRELTRLRVLNLSYNRISRIGQGLSNCTLIKELYLAGNKISDVEGLHRLLKLTVLDLSFNKITTAKALGQLVANYNSLQALNLLGNPIQRNISDDHLRKTVCGLLPKLVYLNKQPIKPQRAREVLTDSVAKAALGNSSRSSYRKPLKKASQGGSVSSSHRGSASVAQKRRNRPKSRNQHRPLSIKGTPQ